MRLSSWVQRNLDLAQYAEARGSEYEGPYPQANQPPDHEHAFAMCVHEDWWHVGCAVESTLCPEDHFAFGALERMPANQFPI